MQIIFDLDGTLFQTEHSIIRAVRLLFDELGLAPADSDSILKSIGKYIPVQKRYIEEYKPLDCSDIVINNNNYLHPAIMASAVNVTFK